MEYTIKDIVQFAAQDNAVKTADAFDAVIMDRVVDAVQQRKVELAQRIFNNQTTAEVENEEEEQDEDSETTAEQD